MMTQQKFLRKNFNENRIFYILRQKEKNLGLISKKLFQPKKAGLIIENQLFWDFS